MPLTPDDVRNKQFTVAGFRKGGYAEEEVDAFLDEVEAELSRLLGENEELRTRMAALQQQAAAGAAAAGAVAAQPPQPLPVAQPQAPAVPGADVVGILEMAQRTANETVMQARSEAQRIMASAQESHRAAMGNLEGERMALQTRVDDLRNFEREYRARLKAYFEAQLRELGSRGDAPPAVMAAESPALAPGSPAAPMPPTPAPPAPQPPQQQPQQQPQQPPQQQAPQQPTPQPQPPQAPPNPQPRPSGPFSAAPPPMPPASTPTVPGFANDPDRS